MMKLCYYENGSISGVNLERDIPLGLAKLWLRPLLNV